MGAERAEALEVLRDLWRGQAQGTADLDECGESSCKRMTDAGVGFDDFAGRRRAGPRRGVAGEARARGQARHRGQPRRPRAAAGGPADGPADDTAR